ncbi:MAG: nucleotide exchange factor GrpE [Pseudomonadota bacterium]
MSDQNDPVTPSSAKTAQAEPDILDESDIARDGDDDALVKAQIEIAALNDRVLRIAAELENTRRRAERDKADAGRYAISNFARDLIGVADNFERALHAADNSEAKDEVVAGLIDGLKMTEKELLAVLDRHGVRRVAAEREKFDPNLHQAVAQIPHAEIPAGHVVDVAQQGFTIGERVLRAAMVTVSSGAAEADRPATPETGGERLDTKV